MANLNDPRERQKFLQEQISLNRQQSNASAATPPVMRADIMSRLMELLEDKEEMEYLRLCRLLWQWPAINPKQIMMHHALAKRTAA